MIPITTVRGPYLTFGPVSQKILAFKAFSNFSSGGHFVKCCRTICTILVEGVMRNTDMWWNYFKFGSVEVIWIITNGSCSCSIHTNRSYNCPSYALTLEWYILGFITQPSIYGVIVYFLLCHESLNYWPVNIFDYWLALYHGLVSHFAVKVKMSHALTTANSNNFVFYGQKHKVWILVFLERADHFETKIEQIWWNFLFCSKTASSTATPFKKHC